MTMADQQTRKARELTQTPETRELVATGQRRYVPNYAPKEMILDRGEGARMWDLDGNEYVDFGAGISVTSLGHGDPDLAEALAAQASRLWHVSNLYFAEPVVRLADELCEASFADRVFFCNSGAEANEAAIKLARKHASVRHGAEKNEIVTFQGGFHGRTIATVTATAQPKYHEGFGPLPGGFRYCEYNDVAALDDCHRRAHLRGAGGADTGRRRRGSRRGRLPRRHRGTLPRARCAADVRRDSERSRENRPAVRPPVGGGDHTRMSSPSPRRSAEACRLARCSSASRASETLQPGSHGSTFGGNPIAAAVARVVLRKLRSDELLANVERQGERLRKRLAALHNEIGFIAEVRGKGLMLGAVLRDEWAGRAGELGEVCRRHGVLVLQAGPDVVRFLPPLNITDAELDDGMDRFVDGDARGGEGGSGRRKSG